MTDQIVPPPEPSGPPVITSSPDVGSIIKFNGASNALRIPLTVWDENTTEELKVHFLLESASLTPVADRTPPDYPCFPEDSIPGIGTVMRTEFALSIPSTKIPRNACTKLSIAISASFVPCEKFQRAEDWSKTSVPGDDTRHRALAVFWIWEVSADPLVNAESAQRLLSSCPTPPSSDATPRSN